MPCGPKGGEGSGWARDIAHGRNVAAFLDSHGAGLLTSASEADQDFDMARVPLLTRNDLPADERSVFDRLEASRGMPTGNIWRALANAPNLLDRALLLADELRHGTTIEKRFRELAVLMVGVAAKSQYEFDHHWNAALKAGLPRPKLQAIGDFATSPLFDDAERAVLRYAKEATETGTVADATWAALREHFDDRKAMEIVVTVAWYNFVVRILLPLEIENENWFKKM